MSNRELAKHIVTQMDAECILRGSPDELSAIEKALDDFPVFTIENVLGEFEGGDSITITRVDDSFVWKVQISTAKTGVTTHTNVFREAMTRAINEYQGRVSNTPRNWLYDGDYEEWSSIDTQGGNAVVLNDDGTIEWARIFCKESERDIKLKQMHNALLGDL